MKAAACLPSRRTFASIKEGRYATQCCLIALCAALSTACIESPTSAYVQGIVGSWRMATPAMGKPVDGVLHILPEGNYILDNGSSAPVARISPSGEGRWSVLRDEIELLAMQASPLSIGPEQHDVRLHDNVARLRIVALDKARLVTADPDYGVQIEWRRIDPLK
jgi:hypothetical protein